MLATPGGCNKADIRQIVGRDQASRRKSATVCRHNLKLEIARALMSKGLQGVSAEVARRLRYRAQGDRLEQALKQQIPPVQEGSQFKCRGQWRIFATRDD
ncbi:hypothetical protein C1X89_25525 [Pseudomonas sp. GP01-A8]|nr:hypothetical protein C0058_24340 [Pseudomonas sp. NC02]PMU24304.1 hypothetical protein C1X90_13755 [Pseudomonas sp. GP01-A9]PMU29228.1 hypothetical protein C1X88_14635 [Pseudomonas sp. GP01-A13]PMU34106.1 hypothetical protein C1X89_25525 [Pseudomonas sp. GP01-A8]PMU48095.1 hypothetical protein C1X87_20760 [Pseudomonas sp. GP01-A14]PMU53485.1 hypothetical protein C1X85_15600 [Pseudomonas sp. GP01-A6]PMU60006.1 hypothetical protein C1X86_25660 [Pseudomonas sp. GP01-A3]PMU72675.1 hypothetica